MHGDQTRSDFVLSAAAWQDSLLQSYRQIFLTVQSILLAVSIAVSLVAITSSNIATAMGSGLELIAVTVLAMLFSNRMQRVIVARGNDVDFWHRLAIRCEAPPLPPHSRHFIRFKISQRSLESSEERKRLNHVFLAADRNFSDSEINDLIGGGWGQTRELLTRWVFNATAWTWRVIIFTTIVVCAWRLHNHTLK